MSRLNIITFGCRLNSYESEVIRNHAQNAGLEDAIIVNTCAVTGEAVRQARQAIRKARREQPDAKIIVTGCAAQIDTAQFASMEEVDHIVGNDEKMHPETFAALMTTESERISVNNIMAITELAPHLLEGFGGRARAYVQIQNGCDHRCTFCIIPYGRGPSRSVPAGKVVAQIRLLVENGYREIVLTGVDITSYGSDLPDKMTLGELVQKIFRLIPELERLRLSSIDSVETDSALLDVIADQSRLMPHLHLSLQSGDDMILKRMKRRHSRSDALRFCDTVRELRPDIVFGADLIAGFPTETEDMFENTLRLVEECGLTYLHIFPFSPRPGTPAARMPQLDREVVKERAQRLRFKGDNMLSRHLSEQTGKVVQLLMEQKQMGRTPQYAEMQIETPCQTGALVNAHVVGHERGMLYGVSLDKNNQVLERTKE